MHNWAGKELAKAYLAMDEAEAQLKLAIDRANQHGRIGDVVERWREAYDLVIKAKELIS